MVFPDENQTMNLVNTRMKQGLCNVVLEKLETIAHAILRIFCWEQWFIQL